MNKFVLHLTVIISLIWSFNIYAADEPALEKRTVKVQAVAITEIYDTYKYPVVIEPKYEREIHAEITGAVLDLYVTVGKAVKKDDALLRLKPTIPGFAEFTIKSPMAGEVTQVTKKLGSYVEKGELLIHIVEPNEFTIKIEIPQADLALLKVKQVGEATFRSVIELLPVEVTGVSSAIAPETGTATGQLEWDVSHFKNDTANLIKQHIYPGMLGTVTFKLNKRTGITIPSKTVLHQKNEDKVIIVKDGKAFRKTIKLGNYLDDWMVEVTSGLQVGDVVVMSTGKYIKENEAVVVE